MSFISVILCDKFLNIMADSRAVELYSNGNVHRVLDENKDKIVRLSDRVFIAVTGCVEDAQNFIDKSDMQLVILEGSRLRSGNELQEWFNNSCQHIVPDYNFNVIFGGLTTDHDLKVYIIDSRKKNLETLTPGQNEIKYFLSGGSGGQNLDNTFAEKTFKELYHHYDGTQESMLRVQEMLNDIIADNDISVNKNKKSMCIKL